MSADSKKTINDPGRLLEKITAEFPNLKWNAYRYVGEGWDHEVIIIDESIVFRFPTDEEYTKKLRNEISVLQFLTAKVTAAIPHYAYISSNYDFAGYRIIDGTQVSKKTFEQLAPDEYVAFVKQLASFLSAIHTLPAEGILRSVSPTYLIEDQADIRSQAEMRLKPLLTSKEYAVAEKILSDIDALLQQTLPIVFIHNDIYGRHLLWDKTRAKLGIIDFSDMCLGDPAIDFAELHEFGLRFVQDVYDHYTGPKDETFMERAWKYQRWVGVYLMTDHFIYQKTSFAIARETFDRVKHDTPS